MRCQDSDRITSVTGVLQLQQLRGAWANGTFDPMKPNSPAAAWYVFFFFHKHVARCATCLWKKMGSSALPEAKRVVYPGNHLV